MNRQRTLGILICIGFALTGAVLYGQSGETANGGGENYLYYRVYASVMVNNPEKSAEELARWAERIGGYYVLKSDDRVVFRFPDSRMAELKPYLEESTEELYGYLPSAEDVREEILFLRSAIESREEILEENLKYLDKTDVEGTLAIEKEVMDILKELEDVKGRLRMLNQNRKYAYAEVSLTFQSQSLPEKLPSSFEWLSELDFYSFIQRGF